MIGSHSTYPFPAAAGAVRAAYLAGARHAVSAGAIRRVRAIVTRWARAGLRVAFQCTLLWLTFLVGTSLVERLALPLPGNLVGLLLLVGLLATGAVRPEELQEITALVSRHLVLLFVPFAIGLINWGELLRRSGPLLATSLIVSAAIGLAAAGSLAQAIQRWRGRSHAD